MALFPAPMDAILGAIKTQNGITLDPTLYAFGAPTPNNDSSGASNTSLTITVNSVKAPYQGSTTVYYTRLSLSDLSQLLPLPIKGNGLSTVQDVVNLLNANFGLNFAAGNADISNVTDALSLDANGAGNVTLTANASSMGWIGTVTLALIKGNYDLNATVTNKSLPGLMYSFTDETKPYADLYSYWRDFSTQTSAIQAITTSTTDMTSLAAILTAISGNTWQSTKPDRYSVQNAQVLYNGPTYTDSGMTVPGYTSPNGGTPSVTYQNVLVVKLDKTASLGYAGLLWIHYSLIDDGFDTDDGS